jgi:hypothetical protein
LAFDDTGIGAVGPAAEPDAINAASGSDRRARERVAGKADANGESFGVLLFAGVRFFAF